MERTWRTLRWLLHWWGQHRGVGWHLHHWRTNYSQLDTRTAASIEIKRQNVDRFDVDIYFDNTKSFLNHHFTGTPAYTPRRRFLYKWNHSNSYSDTKGFSVSYSHSHTVLQYTLHLLQSLNHTHKHKPCRFNNLGWEMSHNYLFIFSFLLFSLNYQYSVCRLKSSARDGPRT